jgi:hypothetical protein
LPKIGEGFGEWFEALLRMKEGWVVVKKGILGKGWRAADVRDLSPGRVCPLAGLDVRDLSLDRG